MPQPRSVALITGASSGIGAELAHVFAARGHEVVLVARDVPRLNAVADAISAAGFARPHVIPVDLSRMDGGARLGHELAARRFDPAYVVNNAGFGLTGGADELDRDEQLAMIDLNVRCLTDLSLRWTDSLQAQRGGILNVASVAGFLPGPGMAVYYATKAYVVSFSAALHYEFKSKGIRVTALCPGPVDTRFQERAGLKNPPIAKLFDVSATKVARDGYRGLMAGKRLVVPGLLNRLLTIALPATPYSLVLPFSDARKRRREPSAPPWRRDEA